jgi:hypothetical protein
LVTADYTADSVTYSKIQNVSATDRLLGRDTAAAGDIEELTATGGIEFTGTGIQTSAFTGDVTKSAGGTSLTIPNDTVTFAKMQNITSDRLLGRDTASSGDVEEIPISGGLEFTGGPGLRAYQWIGYRLCHKDTALTTGELEIDYPPGFTLLDVKANVATVSSSGTPTFDIKENGTTMLSTLITVDASENSSNTAATPPVISDSTFTAYGKLSLHCTVTGTGTKGAMIQLKVAWT